MAACNTRCAMLAAAACALLMTSIPAVVQAQPATDNTAVQWTTGRKYTPANVRGCGTFDHLCLDCIPQAHAATCIPAGNGDGTC
jgi:hypothetical protein